MKTKTLNFFFILILALAMSMGACFLTSAFHPSAATEDVVRPESIEEALDSKSLEEVKDRRVTIRQPVMQVLQRGLPRTAPKVLSNTFVLPDENGNDSLAYVNFEESDYPNGKHVKLSNFKRYMLVRQAKILNARAMEDAQNGTLRKHPGIDRIYGEIPVQNNAVKKRIILDTSYVAPMTTGLYLAPGEVTTIEVSGLTNGQTLTFFTHHQETMVYAVGSESEYYKKYDAMILEEAKKSNPNFEGLKIETISRHDSCFEVLPAMSAKFNITADGIYKIGSPYGGPLYITTKFSSVAFTQPVETIITGAVETPHFILGVTTVKEFEETLRNAPGLIATLDVENGQLIGPAAAMRDTDDIEKLAYFWHSVFTIMESFNGKNFNYDCTLSFDYHVPAGAAVALSADRAAMPASWFPVCMNYGRITTEGNWGTFHELGHIQDDPYGSASFGMHAEGEGEVTNNTMIVMVYAMLCNMDHRVVNVEHGDVSTHPYLILNYQMNNTRNRQVQFEDGTKRPANDYDELDYFDKVSQYATIIHYFGPEKFADFLYTYKLSKQFCEKSWRADYVYRIALVDKMNIMPWLNQEYLANISSDMFSDEQWAYLNSLDTFWPIAYRWANGINENETARKYEVDYLRPTTFDFSEENILCPVHFAIADYSQPLHGKLEIADDFLHATYIPAQDKLYESDEFDVKVRILDSNVVVSLPVRFNFAYNNSYTEVWTDVNVKNLDEAIAYSQQNDLTSVEISSRAGRPNFNDVKGVKSYSLSRFQFVASQSGVHTFYVRADDVARLVAEKDGVEIGQVTRINDYSGFSDKYSFDVDLNKGDLIQFKAHLYNTGGLGYVFAGVKMPDSQAIVEIPKTNMYHYALTADEIAETENFGWQPHFFVSIKNQPTKDAAVKNGWEVIAAPKAQAGSDPQNIVDGRNDTIFHSLWNNGVADSLPHIYVIDTKAEQTYSYFEIVTRYNSNSFIKQMALYASVDNQNWNKIYQTENLEYENLRATIAFDNIKARYFKIEVILTSGKSGSNDFSVIAEVNAGCLKNFEQTVKPTKFATKIENFNENASGELTSNKKGSIFEFEFEGTGFDLFSNTGKDYGSAIITIDGEEFDTISLYGETKINKLVYSLTGLQSKRHLVQIKTTSDAKFHIGFINVDYSSPIDDFVPSAPSLSPDPPPQEAEPQEPSEQPENQELKFILIIAGSIAGVGVIAVIYLMARKKRK